MTTRTSFPYLRRLLRILLPAAVCFLTAADAAWSDDAILPDCRIDEGFCEKSVRSLRVSFELSPKPVKAMRELLFSVTIRDAVSPVPDASVQVSLTMPGMVMGTNIVMLQHKGNGIYEGKGVIVRCPSGKKIWKADVAVRRAGRTTTVPFLIEVH